MESKCLWRSGQRVPLLKAMTKVRILPGTPSLLSSVAERTTLDRVVAGSIPAGGFRPWTGTLNNGIHL